MSTQQADQDLDNLDHLQYILYMSLRYIVQNLCSTDPTDETKARTIKLSASHPATRPTGHADHVNRGSVFPQDTDHIDY